MVPLHSTDDGRFSALVWDRKIRKPLFKAYYPSKVLACHFSAVYFLVVLDNQVIVYNNANYELKFHKTFTNTIIRTELFYLNSKSHLGVLVDGASELKRNRGRDRTEPIRRLPSH